MAASDITSVAFIYKRNYTDKACADIAMRDHPTWHQISKEAGFTGSAFFYPIRYGNPQGISGTFADAQSGASSSKGLQLQASRKTKYGIITLNGEAMAAAEGNKGAFLDIVSQETEGVLEEMGDSFAFDLFRDGSGSRGRRASAVGNVITLDVADDARNFKVGMTVIASANADGSFPRAGSTTVAGVDEDLGTVTLTSAAAITGFLNSDFLFRKGDPGTCMEGMEKCTPLIAPVSGESFRGIDRSVDPRRLAGVRVNDTATVIEENMGLVAVKISQVGKKADRGALNPIRFWEVVRRLNAKVEYQSGGGTADYAFEYVNIHTPAGTVKVYSDPDMPVNRGRVYNAKCHYIKHLRGLPHIVMDDGAKSLRSASADDIEARARGWCNYIQQDTGAHGVFSI
ncbi:MAG: hypothetical protein H0V17_13075 [Deltaproteobacteria bacterium]|nr:hypothetical protein [Deltaproteobacteria bacterium]